MGRKIGSVHRTNAESSDLLVAFLLHMTEEVPTSRLNTCSYCLSIFMIKCVPVHIYN
jgi:hypothetical protein